MTFSLPFKVYCTNVDTDGIYKSFISFIRQNLLRCTEQFLFCCYGRYKIRLLFNVSKIKILIEICIFLKFQNKNCTIFTFVHKLNLSLIQFHSTKNPKTCPIQQLWIVLSPQSNYKINVSYCEL